eukprot:COSAG06_NODE_821_length_12096_cov_5.273735_2_plen_188_part_00
MLCTCGRHSRVACWATAWVGDGPVGDSFRLDGEQHRCRIFAASAGWDLLIPNTWGVADTGRWKLYARAYGVYCAGPDYEEKCISETKALHKWLCSEYIAGAHAGLQQRLIATPVLDGETPAATRLSCECRSFEIWCTSRLCTSRLSDMPGLLRATHCWGCRGRQFCWSSSDSLQRQCRTCSGAALGR